MDTCMYPKGDPSGWSLRDCILIASVSDSVADADDLRSDEGVSPTCFVSANAAQFISDADAQHLVSAADMRDVMSMASTQAASSADVRPVPAMADREQTRGISERDILRKITFDDTVADDLPIDIQSSLEDKI